MIYPRDLELPGRTRDGAGYRIRPIRGSDLDRERAFIEGLSGVSRYRRMLGAFREPPAGLLDQFVNVDYRDRMALLATREDAGAEERIIGVARYAAAAGGSECELAVTVADAWQGRGIGSTLSRLLVEYARARGFRLMTGTVQAENKAMIALALSLGMRLARIPEDPTMLRFSLELLAPGQAAQGREARRR